MLDMKQTPEDIYNFEYIPIAELQKLYKDYAVCVREVIVCFMGRVLGI